MPDIPERVLDLVPIGIYICNLDGQILRYNSAAAELWDRAPKLEDPASRSFEAYLLRRADGSPLAPGEHPVAEVLAAGRPVRSRDFLIERPDGSRIAVLVNIDALREGKGAIAGAICCFCAIARHEGPRGAADNLRLIQDVEMEPGQCRRGELAAQRLAAIVESSGDAIVAKDFNGIITSWNAGAERLFGYTEGEAAGQPISIIIPPERRHEEREIQARIRMGERVGHYETVRRRKDGSLVHVSLSVSPIKDGEGRVVGASKILRDITERRRAEEQQNLLVREMSHRIKNLFTVASSIVALSARTASSSEELALSVQERLAALARAHDLTLAQLPGAAPPHEQATTLHTLIETILLPFENRESEGAKRVSITGPDIRAGGAAVTAFALLIHEFATNAAKYGALSAPSGRIHIECGEENGQFALTWSERGGPAPNRARGEEGFGSLLAGATVRHQLGGQIAREWKPEGLTIRLSFPSDRIAG